MTTLTDTQVVTASGGLVELGYSEITSPVAVNSTNIASPNVCISPMTVVCDGSPVLVEVYTPYLEAPTTAGAGVFPWLSYDGAYYKMGLHTTDVAAASYSATFLSRRLTPSAGSHTFGVVATLTSGSNGGFGAGAGTAGNAHSPAYIRVSKIVTATQWPAVTTGTIICTSSTRPGSPFEGQAIYETDTKRELRWSGTAWVSPSVAYRPPMCINERTGISVADGANAAVAFTSAASVDTDGIHSTSVNNTRFTAKTAGVYLVSANLEPTGGAFANVAFSLELKKNGTKFDATAGVPNAYINPSLNSTALVNLAVNDYVEMWYYNDNLSGGAVTVTGRMRMAWMGQP